MVIQPVDPLNFLAFQTPVLNLTALVTGAVSMLLASVVWGLRSRRLERLRQTVNGIHRASQTLLTATSPADLQANLTNAIPASLEVSNIRLYLYNRQAQTLEPLSRDGAVAIPLDDKGPAWHRVTETFEKQEEMEFDEPSAAPGIIVCFPMQAQNEAAGIMECLFAPGRKLQPEEREALRHLANQAAILLQLLDQRRLRDQAMRGETLGAVGQLISGVAQDLQRQLLHVEEETRELLRTGESRGEGDALQKVLEDAAAASATLDRLLGFGRPDQQRPRPVDLCELVRSLAEFRSQSWRLLLVDADVMTPDEPIYTVASRAQLEQAILGILVHAEQSLAGGTARELHMEVWRDGGKAQLLISVNTELPREDRDPLAATRTILAQYSGTVDTTSTGGSTKFRILLPASDQAEAAPPASSGRMPAAVRPMLVALAGGDPEEMHGLMVLLSERGHRAVQFATAGEAIERLGRVKFDALFVRPSPEEMGWPDLVELSLRETRAVVRLATSQESPALPPSESGVHWLRYPTGAQDLDSLLNTLGHRTGRPPARQ